MWDFSCKIWTLWPGQLWPQRGINDAWSIRDVSASEKMRDNRSSSSSGKHKDFRDRVEVIRAKAKSGHLARQGR